MGKNKYAAMNLLCTNSQYAVLCSTVLIMTNQLTPPPPNEPPFRNKTLLRAY